jgi:O-antigen ligase/tetratricopeptide (TPR) repeat protein
VKSEVGFFGRPKLMALPTVLLGLLYFTTIFFGGAHLWSQTILILALFLSTLAILWSQTFIKSRDNKVPVSIFRDPVSLVGLLFLLWIALSLIPLPAHILKALSPQTFQIWETTSLVGGQFPHPLSLYPYMTINSWVFSLVLLVFYWLALYGIRSRRQIHWLVMGLVILGALESLYALVQVATARPYILWWQKDVSQDVATGSLIYRNQFACLLSMITCLGVGYLWALGREHQQKRLTQKPSLIDRVSLSFSSLGTRGITLLSILALMMAALLVTASRGGTLSLLAGLVFMSALLASRFFKSRQAVILLLALLISCSYVGYVALDRVLERFQTFELGFQDRLAIAQETFRMGRDFPVTGTGWGAFEFVYPRYQERSFNVLMDYAHNDWAQLFSETGLVGLILLAGGLLWLLVRYVVLWLSRKDPFSVGIGLGGMGALVSVSIHSLSDFNLHLPANALLLAVICAITTLALQDRGEKGQGLASQPEWRLNIPLWTALPILALITLGIGALGWRTVQVWQADSLARTVWNSTLPFKAPSDKDLIKAWSLAPGNAHYWAWLASRVPKEPRVSNWISRFSNQEPSDIRLYLLGQGIQRNPTAWSIWRDLGWTFFLKAANQPKSFFPKAEQAMAQAVFSRPYDAQRHLEAGMVGLASSVHRVERDKSKSWKEDFYQALSLNPDLYWIVVDQVLLYLGPSGAQELKGILPTEAKANLLTGIHLLKKGIYPEGLELLGQGEQYREREIDRLWEKVSQGKAGSLEKRKKLLVEILQLDPLHPGALLTQGRVLESLLSQDRRKGVLRDLADLKELSWSLRQIEGQKQGSIAEVSYSEGRVAEEEGDFKNARNHFHRSLQANPQYFPAWVHLKTVLTKIKQTAGDQVEIENLQKKIHFFEMDQVVGDAWTPADSSLGNPQWKATYRSAQRQEKMEIHFSGETAGSWKLLVDGRFVTAWAGSKYQGEKKIMIPEGEHDFKLIYFKESNKVASGKLPFSLRIIFRQD